MDCKSTVAGIIAGVGSLFFRVLCQSGCLLHKMEHNAKMK